MVYHYLLLMNYVWCIFKWCQTQAQYDYVTTTANTISSLFTCRPNDEVEVIVYDVFSLADMVSSANGGNFFNQVNFKTDSGVVAFGVSTMM